MAEYNWRERQKSLRRSEWTPYIVNFDPKPSSKQQNACGFPLTIAETSRRFDEYIAKPKWRTGKVLSVNHQAETLDLDIRPFVPVSSVWHYPRECGGGGGGTVLEEQARMKKEGQEVGEEAGLEDRKRVLERIAAGCDESSDSEEQVREFLRNASKPVHPEAKQYLLDAIKSSPEYRPVKQYYHQPKLRSIVRTNAFSKVVDHVKQLNGDWVAMVDVLHRYRANFTKSQDDLCASDEEIEAASEDDDDHTLRELNINTDHLEGIFKAKADAMLDENEKRRREKAEQKEKTAASNINALMWNISGNPKPYSKELQEMAEVFRERGEARERRNEEKYERILETGRPVLPTSEEEDSNADFHGIPQLAVQKEMDDDTTSVTEEMHRLLASKSYCLCEENNERAIANSTLDDIKKRAMEAVEEERDHETIVGMLFGKEERTRNETERKRTAFRAKLAKAAKHGNISKSARKHVALRVLKEEMHSIVKEKKSRFIEERSSSDEEGCEDRETKSLSPLASSLGEDDCSSDQDEEDDDDDDPLAFLRGINMTEFDEINSKAFPTSHRHSHPDSSRLDPSRREGLRGQPNSRGSSNHDSSSVSEAKDETPRGTEGENSNNNEKVWPGKVSSKKHRKAAIGTAAGSARKYSGGVYEWDEAQVAEWVCSLGRGHKWGGYSAIIRENGVDGPTIMASDAASIEELGISKIHALLIKRRVTEHHALLRGEGREGSSASTSYKEEAATAKTLAKQSGSSEGKDMARSRHEGTTSSDSASASVDEDDGYDEGDEDDEDDEEGVGLVDSIEDEGNDCDDDDDDDDDDAGDNDGDDAEARKLIETAGGELEEAPSARQSYTTAGEHHQYYTQTGSYESIDNTHNFEDKTAGRAHLSIGDDNSSDDALMAKALLDAKSGIGLKKLRIGNITQLYRQRKFKKIRNLVRSPTFHRLLFFWQPLSYTVSLKREKRFALEQEANNYKIPRKDRNKAKEELRVLNGGKRQKKQSRGYGMGIGIALKQQSYDDLQEEQDWLTGRTK
eukprot:jgi/Bigna1/144131/aug1.84_g18839